MGESQELTKCLVNSCTCVSHPCPVPIILLIICILYLIYIANTTKEISPAVFQFLIFDWHSNKLHFFSFQLTSNSCKRNKTIKISNNQISSSVNQSFNSWQTTSLSDTDIEFGMPIRYPTKFFCIELIPISSKQNHSFKPLAFL